MIFRQRFKSFLEVCLENSKAGMLALFVCSFLFGTISPNNYSLPIKAAYGSLLQATICTSGTSYTLQDDQFTITGEISFYCCVILFLFYHNYFTSLGTITISIGLYYQLQSSSLILTFITLELVNISLYVLVCTYSSGIKYIITSQIVTTLFVLGLALNISGGFMWAGLMAPTFLLKLGIFPFHQLTADLYDGLPTKVMMQLNQPIKLGIYLFTQHSLVLPYFTIASAAILQPAISTGFALTFKRFISLSSSSYQTQLFIGMAVVVGSSLANYAIVYTATLAIIMITYGTPIVTIQFLSIAGLPPFIGFYYKVKQVSDQLNTEAFGLIAIFLASSLILTANYLERTSNAVGRKSYSITITTTTSQLLQWSIIG